MTSGLQHQLITLSSTATILSIPSLNEIENSRQLVISVQNLDSQAYVYLGDSTVTSSSYGYRIDPGQTFTADLRPSEELYAVGSSSIAVIRLIRNG